MPARPFFTAGMDYAGQARMRTSMGREHRSYKTYITLLIFFATRAVHLELVSDLRTKSVQWQFTVLKRHIAKVLAFDKPSATAK